MSEQSDDTKRVHLHQQLDKQQRQQTRRYIMLPFTLLILILIAIVVVMLSLRSPTQVAIVSDFLLTLFVLCPLVICLLPIVILMIALMGLMGKLHSGTKSPLRRIEQWTYSMEKRIESWAHLADSQVLNWVVRFAPIYNLLTMFDEEPQANQKGEAPDGTTEARK